MAKADNMLSILWLLYSRKRMTADEISEELEISIRTVYRYMDALCASGVPIISESGHDGGYRLTEHFRHTPLFFERNEIKAMFHAAQFAQRAGHPHSDALESALTKLKRNASPDQLEYLNRDVQGFSVISSRRGGPVEPWLRILEEAVENGNTLEVLYQKANADQPEWRKVDPYGLAHDSGLWYLAVFCHQREAMRDFRVDRIVNIQPTDEHFEPPADFSVSEYFSIKDMIERVQTGPFTPVRIRGEVWTLNSLCDHWYLRYCVVERTRGEVILQFNADSMERIPKMLLSYGSDIEVLDPALLRKQLRELACQWAEHYTNHP